MTGNTMTRIEERVPRGDGGNIMTRIEKREGVSYPYFQPLLDEAPPRICQACGCILVNHEVDYCDDCEGEAFAEDEWIESACATAGREDY